MNTRWFRMIVIIILVAVAQTSNGSSLRLAVSHQEQVDMGVLIKLIPVRYKDENAMSHEVLLLRYSLTRKDKLLKLWQVELEYENANVSITAPLKSKQDGEEVTGEVRLSSVAAPHSRLVLRCGNSDVSSAETIYVIPIELLAKE